MSGGEWSKRLCGDGDGSVHGRAHDHDRGRGEKMKDWPFCLCC